MTILEKSVRENELVTAMQNNNITFRSKE